MIKYNYFLIFIFLFNAILARDNTVNISFLTLDNSSNAWWLNNNNHGISYDNFQSIVYYSKKNEKRKIVGDIVIQQNKVIFREIFVDYNISDTNKFKFGKYYRDYSNYLNDELSSGHMILSNNAEAIKKIGFISFKEFKNRNLKFNFGINNGLLDKSKIYIEAPFFHEKFLTLNYAKKNFSFSVGFVHNAIWGGSILEIGKQPSSIKDFLKVVIAADGPKLEGEPHANALGNHIGLWDFHFLLKRNSYNYNFYYQHIFEDTSGLRFANKTDGLWGFELIKNNDQSRILFEYLNTSNQQNRPPYVNEGYYNHYQYKEGWSYKNYALGNSFIDPLNVVLLKVAHIGFQHNFDNNTRVILKASRRIDAVDKIKYKFSVSKNLNLEFLKEVKLFVANGDLDSSFGLGLSFQLK